MSDKVPTTKQIEFAEDLANKKGLELPDNYKTDAEAIDTFLKANTPQVTQRQIAAATKLAKEKGIDLPQYCTTNVKVMNAFLKQHLPPKKTTTEKIATIEGQFSLAKDAHDPEKAKPMLTALSDMGFVSAMGSKHIPENINIIEGKDKLKGLSYPELATLAFVCHECVADRIAGAVKKGGRGAASMAKGAYMEYASDFSASHALALVTVSKDVRGAWLDRQLEDLKETAGLELQARDHQKGLQDAFKQTQRWFGTSAYEGAEKVVSGVCRAMGRYPQHAENLKTATVAALNSADLNWKKPEDQVRSILQGVGIEANKTQDSRAQGQRPRRALQQQRTAEMER